MSTTCSLGTNDDIPSCDSSFFCSLIRSLHYLSITRSDVAFAVNKLSQYMQAPLSIHMQALKRILRYLKHIIFHGIHLVATRNLDLIAFCNADWGGDNVDWKSTGAYIVYLGPNAFHGHAKNSPQLRDLPLRPNIAQSEPPRLNSYGFNNFSWSLGSKYLNRQTSSQITLVLRISVQTQCSIHK